MNKMGSNVWKQRVTRNLKRPDPFQSSAGTTSNEDQNPSVPSVNYLHPVSMEGNDEPYYYLGKQTSKLLEDTPSEYSFEESFWLVPDFFDFVEYKYDPVSKKATITPPTPRANPEAVNFVFKKILLNLEKKDKADPMLTPGSVHPCDDGPGGAAATAPSNNCMAAMMTEDNHFLLFYAKDTQNSYRTDASGYKIRLNNYLIPTLSADMSIWWYRIPNHKIEPTDNFIEKWRDDDHALANAEQALSIWHQDYEAFKAALQVEAYKDLESKFYIGVYQRSYFSDELQMRFVNVARIGNDSAVRLSLGVSDHSEIRYKPLKPNFPRIMLGV